MCAAVRVGVGGEGDVCGVRWLEKEEGVRDEDARVLRVCARYGWCTNTTNPRATGTGRGAACPGEDMGERVAVEEKGRGRRQTCYGLAVTLLGGPMEGGSLRGHHACHGVEHRRSPPTRRAKRKNS